MLLNTETEGDILNDRKSRVFGSRPESKLNSELSVISSYIFRDVLYVLFSIN